MEFWFSELHSPHVKFDIRVEKQLFSGESDYQRIDVFQSPEFGKFLTLNGSVIFSEQDCFIYNEMVVHVPMSVHPDVRNVLIVGGGDGGYPYATNFNPEVNLREVSAPGSYWEDGKWVEISAMSIKREYNFDEVGEKDMYLLHHEEIEALGKNMPEVKRIRFFMTFGESYLTHMKCLENVGMLSTTPVEFNGQQIVPIQFLKEFLPDPSTLGPRTVGKTNIGCIFIGIKDGKERSIYIYNVCDHQECFKEVDSQAVSYTTGVPPMIGTMLVLQGLWNKPGVYTTDEFDPDPYMDALNKWGLPWKVVKNPTLVD